MSGYTGVGYMQFIGLDPDDWPDLTSDLEEAVADAAFEAAEATVAEHVAKVPLLRALLSPGCPSLTEWVLTSESPAQVGDRVLLVGRVGTVSGVNEHWYTIDGDFKDYQGYRTKQCSVRRDSSGLRVLRPIPVDFASLVA